MDFLKIREKAKARALARDAAKAPPAEPRDAAAAGDAAAEEGAEAAGAAEAAARAAGNADALDGELAERLRGLPPAEDGRFTTWRPGTGASPRFAEAPAPVAPEPRPEDFSVVPAPGGRLAPLPAPPAPPGGPAGSAAPPAADPLDEFFFREDEAGPEVPVIGPAGAEGREAAPPDTAAREEYLTFFLGEEEYAVAIERVREVLKPPPLTEVPRAPRPVLGVVTVRGEVVAVFDPRARLGLPGPGPAPDAGRLVIVDAGGGPCALLVDAVASVVRLRPGSIEPRPQSIGGAAADCLAGIGRQGGRLFTVLDLAALFRRPAGAARPDEEERRART